MPEVNAPDTPANKPALALFQKRKQLERNIEHITSEMYKRNRELAETNKTLTLLRTIDAYALESHATLKTVCENITRAISDVTNYPLVGLLTRSVHSKEELVLNGLSTGFGPSRHQFPTPDFSKPIHISLSHPWFNQLESTGLISLEAVPDEALATFLSCPLTDIRRVKQQIPLKSLYLVKLLARRQVMGVLFVGFTSSTYQLTNKDTLLMDRLSESTGVALDNKLLFEENQHVLRQLKESNFKLQALDEAKDDFISMASHQLRTPLTAIKGYTSMVLEGDAGKITKTQKELLTQSFFSSQRMVYLISDLLNVSRLRTGKFIVETVPVDLAEVVEQEVEQLKATAASRELTLTYKKPKHFPSLMLDETKTRQIIMNFTDNAIYYTPAGGHIKVHLVDNKTTVELRVEDDGMGVPRSEQPHLFTKFYRAGNARKARPDGTGLGLFMAKKVIVAQGGTLIFHTEEGKGSTFGFSFDKAKLLPNPSA